jgi:hypothetical protein
MPRHARLPRVNETMYLVSRSDLSPASIQRSGLKECESGKMVSSWWTKYVDILMGVYSACQLTAIAGNREDIHPVESHSPRISAPLKERTEAGG